MCFDKKRFKPKLNLKEFDKIKVSKLLLDFKSENLKEKRFFFENGILDLQLAGKPNF
jgi:hypothetical protein